MGSGFFTALDSIYLSFEKGEFAGLIGPSGSGKTTLLNIIGALDSPSEGSVTVLGRSVEKLSQKEAALLRNHHIGFIFQTYNLLPVYTVYENVEFPLLLLGMEKEEREKKVNNALEWVGLTDKRDSRPSQLSGGQSQRVAVARALVGSAPLILADEPTGNLDTKTSGEIMDLFVELNGEGHTLLVVTHEPDIAKYSRRTLLFKDGRLVEDERRALHA